MNLANLRTNLLNALAYAKDWESASKDGAAILRLQMPDLDDAGLDALFPNVITLDATPAQRRWVALVGNDDGALWPTWASLLERLGITDDMASGTAFDIETVAQLAGMLNDRDLASLHGREIVEGGEGAAWDFIHPDCTCGEHWRGDYDAQLGHPPCVE